MEITFLGGSCLRLKGRDADVLVDPPSGDAAVARLSADLIIRTEGSGDAAQLRRVEGGPQEVGGPGEYELRGVRIRGLSEGWTTVMSIDIDDVRVVAVGLLHRALAETTIEALGRVDVLAVPIGGGEALSAMDAARLVNALEPSIVVPVHFRHGDLVEGRGAAEDGIERFAKEMGLTEGWTAQSRLSLNGGGGAGDDIRVVVLEPRHA